MEVAVWDTYVKQPDGSVLHFDILVPASLKDANTIYRYGRQYLAGKNLSEATLDTDECRFCHIEAATPAMLEAIEKQGYYMVEMDTIPATLPPNPTRRDLILHLRGHSPRHRFADLRGKSEDELKKLIHE